MSKKEKPEIVVIKDARSASRIEIVSSNMPVRVEERKP